MPRAIPMPEYSEAAALFDAATRIIEFAVEAAGVAILVVGALLASASFLRRVGRVPSGEAYRRFRADLGRVLLLGLEFLVIADVVGTVSMEPTFASLGFLAGLILIRIVLSFSLEVELNGRWPWREREMKARPAPHEEL